MTVRDHEPLTISNFRGLFNRGDEDTAPPGFFISSLNNRFIPNGVKTREGSSLDQSFGATRHMEIYKRIGEAQRLLVLGSSGNLYDSLDLTVPILTVSGMTDFSSVTAYNRAYITPHNGVTGLPGEKVYVYSGSGLARGAAGTAPTGGSVVVSDSATSGHVDTGDRLIGIAFESDTGFISGIGYFALAHTAGGFKLNVASIPLGPAGTVARHVLSTKKLIGTFNGDFVHQDYFFIPNGRIGDNTTSAYNDILDFFDADLEDSAGFLLDILPEIPAGVGIGIYNGHLIVWGEDANSSIVRVSKSGEPESMSAVDGFATINPGDSGFGLKSCWEYNKLLICQKSNRTYFTLDNGLAAAFWSTDNLLDASVGTEPHGVAQIEDYGHTLENVVIIAHKTGLRLFNGTFAIDPLTLSIDWLWDRINKSAFNQIQAAIDATNRDIYVAIPLDDATTPSHILYGNFDAGLTAEGIKWDLWQFPVDPKTIVVDVNNITSETELKIGALAGSIYKMDTDVVTDFTNRIDNFIEFSLLPLENDDSIMHFTGCRVRVKGSGVLKVSARGLDDEDGDFAVNGDDITLALKPRFANFSGFNFTGERCSVKLALTNVSEFYTITKVSIYAGPEGEQRGPV